MTLKCPNCGNTKRDLLTVNNPFYAYCDVCSKSWFLNTVKNSGSDTSEKCKVSNDNQQKGNKHAT